MTDETPTPLWKLSERWVNVAAKFRAEAAKYDPDGLVFRSAQLYDLHAHELEAALAAFDVDAAARETWAAVEREHNKFLAGHVTAKNAPEIVAAALRAAAAAGNRVCALSEDGKHEWLYDYYHSAKLPEPDSCMQCGIKRAATAPAGEGRE